MYNIKIYLCPGQLAHVSRLPRVEQYTFLWITLAVSEVVGTVNRVTSSLPFLLNPSCIAEMQL